MKKITFLIILFCISLSYSQELFENPGFEDGNTDSGWNDNLTGPGYSYNTDAVQAGFVVGTYTLEGPHSGTYAGRMKGGDAAFIQTETVTPGETYIIQFWFANQFAYLDLAARVRDFTGDTNGTFIDLVPMVSDSGQNAGDATKYGCNNPDNSGAISSWKEAKFSFVVPTGVTKIKFQYFAASGTGNQFVDDASLTQGNTASIEDLEKFNFKSYPNPTTDYIELSAAKKIDRIEVYDLLGKQVLKKSIDSVRNNVNVSNLTSGMYIMKAYIEDAEGTFKFVKK